MTNESVVICWARQNTKEGESRNINFQGDTIYSYGHYPIGRFIGNHILLIQSYNYSTTTAKHIRLVKKHARRVYRFIVPDLTLDHEKNLQYYYEELENRAKHFWGCFRNRTSPAFHFACYNATVDELRNYARCFNQKIDPLAGYELQGEKAQAKLEEIKQRTWNDVYIPKWLFYKKHLHPFDMLDIKNAQVRAEFVKKVGIDKIVDELGKPIDTVGNYQLVMLRLGDHRQRPYLKMLNPSVPNQWHIEGVHPNCKSVYHALQYRRYGREFINTLEGTKDIVLEDWTPEILT